METFIVRVFKKEKWDGGFINMDLSWDVPMKELPAFMQYLSLFKKRAKRKSPSNTK